MTTFQFGETVTLVRRVKTGVDADGNDVYGTTLVPADGAVFDPGGTTEAVQGQDQVVQTPRFIWVDVLPDVTAVDAVNRANGDQFEVTGEPLRFGSPFTGKQVLELHVKRVTG